MKIAASILALIAFVAIFMTVLTEARLGRPSYTQGNGRTYRSNGHTMNSRGYLANPTRSAQINARNAGALTNSEARSMGLRNYRDEIDNDESVGWYLQNGKRYPGSGMGDEMEETVGARKGYRDNVNWPDRHHRAPWKEPYGTYSYDAGFDEEESVGWDDQPSHTRAQRPTGESISNYYNNWRL